MHVSSYINVYCFLASTINSQDQVVVPVGGKISLTCKSSVSSNVRFTWTRNKIPIIGRSRSSGDTSVLTITNIKSDDAGNYVCTVWVDTLVVLSNTVVLTTIIIGMLKEINVTLSNYLVTCLK